jgi:hypothetical protein
MVSNMKSYISNMNCWSIIRELRHFGGRMAKDSILLVISNFDLMKFGCPHCGSFEGGIFIVSGTCSIWNCSVCLESCVVVGKYIKEVSLTLRDTDLKDLIGNHPYKNDCQINSFSLKIDNIYLS